MDFKKMNKYAVVGNVVAIGIISVVSLILLYYLGITGLSAVGITTALATLGAFSSKKMLAGIAVLSTIAILIKTATDKVTGLISNNKRGEGSSKA